MFKKRKKNKKYQEKKEYGFSEDKATKSTSIILLGNSKNKQQDILIPWLQRKI